MLGHVLLFKIIFEGAPVFSLFAFGLYGSLVGNTFLLFFWDPMMFDDFVFRWCEKV